MSGSELRTVGLVHTGTAWDHGHPLGQQRLIAEHLAYLKTLAQQGDVLHAGPVIGLDRAPGPDGLIGLVVYRVDVERARRLAERDPAVTGGLVRCDARPWTLIVNAESMA